MQKIAYGFLGLKPNEFWELQPRDIMIMYEGLKMRHEYEEMQHLQTLRLLRHIGYTELITTPTKKGYRFPKLKDYYPLPFDGKAVEVTEERKQEIMEAKDSVITNGKLRGYVDKDGNLYNKHNRHIGYYIDGVLEYIN